MMTILVVDDEAIVRETCESMLESLGFASLPACHGREALEVLEREGARIAAVVMDVSMPIMNGEEALEVIRARYPRLPVLLTSGYCPPEVAARLERHVRRMLEA